MVGELDGVGASGDERGLGLDRLGETAMQRCRFAGEEVLEDGFTQQGVAKSEAVAVDDQQLGIDSLA